MSLFKTSDELKVILPKAVGDIVEHVRPFTEAATDKYIKKFLGDEAVAELDAAYNDESTDLSDTNKALLLQVQRPLAWFAMLMYADQGGVLISKSGFRIASTDEMKTAFKWQIDELKVSYRAMGYYGIESLIKFLDAHPSDYATYTSSDAFESNREHFINYASDFERYYFIDSSRDTYEVLRPQMREIESTLILDTLGEDYYDELKEKIKDDDLNSDDENILFNLKSAIAKLTIAAGIISNAIKITSRGVVVTAYENANDSNVNERPAGEGERSSAYQQALSSGQAFLRRVSDYLNKNADETTYPTYFQSTTYVDPDADDTSFDNSNEGAKIFVT